MKNKKINRTDKSFTVESYLNFSPNRQIDFKTGDLKIRQWPINLCTSPMKIHQITPSEDYNQYLKRLDTQLNEQTN